MNHCGLLPLRELHSTGETIVWRDPGGSWACLLPVHKCNHPTTACDTCGLHPKKHTKKRGALGNTKKTKITRAGTWVEQKPLQLRTRSWVEEGLSECSMKNQSEETGAPWSAKKTTTKKNWAEKAKGTARKNSTRGRKVPLKKNNHEKELGKKLKKPKKKT